MISNLQFTKGVVITPSDTVNFVDQGTADRCCSAIYCSAAGNVVVVFQDGSTATFTVIAGTYLWVKAKRVNSTLTTVAANSLIALYAL